MAEKWSNTSIDPSIVSLSQLLLRWSMKKYAHPGKNIHVSLWFKKQRWHRKLVGFCQTLFSPKLYAESIAQQMLFSVHAWMTFKHKQQTFHRQSFCPYQLKTFPFNWNDAAKQRKLHNASHDSFMFIFSRDVLF